MPDTGAPWNIPYVDPTDLVIDYPVANEAMADAVAAGLTAAAVDATNASLLTSGTLGKGRFPSGAVLNVVQTVKLDVFTTSSTTFTPVTGLTATITPTSSSSKILLLLDTHFGSDTLSNNRYRIMRGVNVMVVAAGTVGTGNNIYGQGSSTQHVSHSESIAFLDSPATTAATSYTVEVLTSSGAIVVNNGGAGASNTISSITLFEVAG